MSVFRRSGAVGSAVVLGSSAFATGVAAQSPQDWTFAYAGGHAGYDWSEAEFSQATSVSIDLDGGAAGLLGGINFFQSGNIVAGFEADFTWLGGDGTISESTTTNFSCSSGSANVSESASISADLNWKATLRGRAGVLVDPNVFVYGTAGVAWANADVTSNLSTLAGFDFFTCTATIATIATREDMTFFGGVVGGGTETLIAPNIYARAEVLHFFFEDETTNLLGVPVNVDLDETIARGAVVFRFN